jgi:hypothetical protein
MNPAPGFDERMPHDLMHFVVERELGLRNAIFGQLAAGGTAGTFRAASGGAESDREAARQRRALARRGARLQQQGRADAAMSERMADVCWRAWSARAAGRKVAVTGAMGCSAAELHRICDVLDKTSTAWAKLSIGQALTLHWPDAPGESGRIAAVRPN